MNYSHTFPKTGKTYGHRNFFLQRRYRKYYIMLLFAVCLYILKPTIISVFATPTRPISIEVVHAKHVPVDLFVMSKCPDALACEKALAPVFNQLHELVDIRTNYLASRNSAQPYACMHGSTECAGNRYQLCASHWVTSYASHAENYNLFYRFILCQNKDVSSIGEAEAANQCLLSSGFLPAAAQEIISCANGNLGKDLMEKSMDYCRSQNVSVSCTVRIGSSECIVDGGKWNKECPSGGTSLGFWHLICDAFVAATGEPMPQICSDESFLNLGTGDNKKLSSRKIIN